jgi:hypothetical protein
MTASAPILFGLIADQLVRPGVGTTSNGAHGFGANANAHSPQLAFLILLITLALGGILTFLAAQSYPGTSPPRWLPRRLRPRRLTVQPPCATRHSGIPSLMSPGARSQMPRIYPCRLPRRGSRRVMFTL